MELPIEPIPSENKPVDKRIAQMAYKSLPKLPMTCCILGRIGTGKSSCLYSMLEKGYVYGKNNKSVFHEIVFFVGNMESDEALQALPCKNIRVLHSFDHDALHNYLENLRAVQLKRLEDGKAPHNVAIVFDDFAAANLLKKRKGASPLASLILTCRHELNTSVIVLSQIYKSVGFSTPVVRNNITSWIIYNMSKPESRKIWEDHLQDFELDEIMAHYEEAMATPHNFFVVDYRRPLDQRITEGFTKVLKPIKSEVE
jgi:hypothetical protein